MDTPSNGLTTLDARTVTDVMVTEKFEVSFVYMTIEPKLTSQSFSTTVSLSRFIKLSGTYIFT